VNWNGAWKQWFQNNPNPNAQQVLDQLGHMQKCFGLESAMRGTKFWILSSPSSTWNLAEWVDSEVEVETVKCSLNAGHERGGRRLSTLSVTLPADPIDDFIWTWQSECLIQEHVRRLLEARCFSGFQAKPVKARFERDNKKTPILWEMIVTGWGGMAASGSGIRLLEHCYGCGHLRYSKVSNPEMLIDEAQWEGSDFFIVWPLPRYIFITDRVAQSIIQAEWRGVRILTPSEIDWSGISFASGFTPGRLSYSMPEGRARELGQPLGIY
jgi:hypothetical protein